MVSLINFKNVGEELQRPLADSSLAADGSQLFIRMMPPPSSQQSGVCPPASQQQQCTPIVKSHKSSMDINKCQPTRTSQASQQTINESLITNNNNNNNEPVNSKQAPVVFMPLASLQQQPQQPMASVVDGAGSCNFVVTWRNLNFSIEPKWHERALRVAMGGSGAPQKQAGCCKTGAPTDQQQDQQAATQSQQQQVASKKQATTKTVLDRLDGSFKSGELTAILGPSGAGKTTLLDCLTGRRKNGLTGSIGILGSAPSMMSSGGADSTDCAPQKVATLSAIKCLEREQLYFDQTGPILTPPLDGSASGKFELDTRHRTTSDNLKVSIIPQNDHLMGHLTVYETLIYASKMKNCFDRNFDHRLNVKRVAQQLGLLSCLDNRINKLSGGQYKRVSIAQELLSSPDILILDEPTSGLDAMTCYQTVQVLRRLVDERRASGQSQIAVILTIHQPNSDVFQQFNHVYVVAQGGCCIYEGPPASIESMINRVGIRMPSSYYNPATMIVEIAAGKFGCEAIEKLNVIQKKQYLFQSTDEQLTMGDSAVDCPSGSSFASSSDFSSSLSSSLSTNEDEEPKTAAAAAEAGQVNKGFVMEKELPVVQLDNGKGVKNVIINVVANNLDQQVMGPGELPLDKINLATGGSQALDRAADETRIRKKRRRTRKRTDEQPTGSLTSGELASNNNPQHHLPHHNNSASSAHHRHTQQTGYLVAGSAGAGHGQQEDDGGGGGNHHQDNNSVVRHRGGHKRLKLNSLKADQKFPFWRHTYLHFHRSWLSIVRDPMLCSMQLALHILVPIMVSLVYGTKVGKPNACPRAGPVNIMAYALEPADKALELQEDFRTTIENIGYIFFKLYGIIFAAMTVTVLTFPLDMHVLVKEFRNGWYGLSSYFLGRTLADIPFALTLPLLAMSLSYYATGQPYSYFQWRFLSITAVLILSSLIAQSQGLLFGAILMDRMKAAVFVAPAATTPIILFAGFLVRTQTIPAYLRPLSNLSYLRYAIEACLISRYGFNQCQCDPAIFNQTVPELPPIARSMLDYWLSSFKPTNESWPEDGAGLTSLTTTPEPPPTSSQSPDLFSKLIDSLAKANSFGRNITSCEQVVPYPMIDYDLKDSQLINCFAILLFMLLITRLLTFFIVCTKVRRKV